MRKVSGILLAILGVAILATSLVLSASRSGHSAGEERAARIAEQRAMEARSARILHGEERSAAQGPQGPRPDRSPLQEAGLFQFRADEPDALLVFPIPPGKRFVLEHVSLRAQLQENRRATALLTTSTGGGYATHVLPLASQGKFPEKGEVFAVSQPIRAYADGGTNVQVRVERTAGSDADTGFVSITGYLADMP